MRLDQIKQKKTNHITSQQTSPGQITSNHPKEQNQIRLDEVRSDQIRSDKISAEQKQSKQSKSNQINCDCDHIRKTIRSNRIK